MIARKWAEVIILVGLCCLMMLVINILHFRFFVVNVVLYDSMLDALIASILVGGFYIIFLRRRVTLNGLEVALSAIIGLLLSAFYALSMPTIIDRSLSIYLLEKIAQRGGGIRQDAFATVFKDEYMPEHRLVDIRLTEQLNSGTIRIENGCVQLTTRGERVVAFSRFYRMNLLPKNREIMGQLSDALTDPFRASKQAGDYTCAAVKTP